MLPIEIQLIMSNNRIVLLLSVAIVFSMNASPAFMEGVTVAQHSLEQPPLDHIIATPFDELANATVPTMEWSATTQQEHHTWRARFQAKLRELLGRMPERVPLEVKWTERREFDTFTRHKVYVQTEKSYWAPIYYFVPHDLKKPAPAIVCLHGHSGIYPYIRADRTEDERKRTRDASLDYAVYFAEHGYVSAAIVVRGWNETAGYHDRGITHVTRSCHQVTMNAFLQGMTPQGLRCWDAMRVIDFLQDQNNVDGQRIAVAGLSGGGTLATYLPVLDDRVKLVMIGGAFSSYRTSICAMDHCIWNCPKGKLRQVYWDSASRVPQNHRLSR